MCGEHVLELAVAGSQRGSSPRVRGTPVTAKAVCWLVGIIPACAGNTMSFGTHGAGSRDHPRVCGEHEGFYQAGGFLMGSSPRVRGTPIMNDPFTYRRGIIPACAGNTDFRPGRIHDSRDHPRVCGEHRYAFMFSAALLGSSPRVRGTLIRISDQPSVLGIIPACAGNTTRRAAPRWRWWDHPRVCGEHSPVFETLGNHVGSSPRVRGTPAPAEANLFDPGIIPACAGNTLIPRRAGLFFWDHPRVCGEHKY